MVRWRLDASPWGIDDTVIQVNAECQTDVLSTLGWLVQTGRVHLTYLGAAQCDRYGNLNTTLYGDDYTRRRPAYRVAAAVTTWRWARRILLSS